jgi:hypothetical protein
MITPGNMLRSIPGRDREAHILVVIMQLVSSANHVHDHAVGDRAAACALAFAWNG